MSVEQYPSNMWVKQLDSDEIALIGSFQFPNRGELQYGNLYLIKKGALVGSPKARLHFYSRADLEVSLFQSDWRSFSNIDGIDDGSQNWLGWVRFDFGKQSINPNITYYVAIEMDDYTPNLSTESHFIGFFLDGPVYTTESDLKTTKQGKIEFYLWQTVDWSGG